MAVRSLALPLLCVCFVAGCSVPGVGMDSWGRGDEYVVLAEPPADSDLPEAREDSRATALFHVELQALGPVDETSMAGVGVRRRPGHVEVEPLDLDILLRMDGAAGQGTRGWQLDRSYEPQNVPEGTGTLLRIHRLDWTRKPPVTTTEPRLFGDPEKPYITADIYMELSIAGREFTPEGWFVISRLRTRLVSDHPDWVADESTVTFDLAGGITMGMPLFAAK